MIFKYIWTLIYFSMTNNAKKKKLKLLSFYLPLFFFFFFFQVYALRKMWICSLNTWTTRDTFANWISRVSIITIDLEYIQRSRRKVEARCKEHRWFDIVEPFLFSLCIKWPRRWDNLSLINLNCSLYIKCQSYRTVLHKYYLSNEFLFDFTADLLGW